MDFSLKSHEAHRASIVALFFNFFRIVIWVLLASSDIRESIQDLALNLQNLVSRHWDVVLRPPFYVGIRSLMSDEATNTQITR